MSVHVDPRAAEQAELEAVLTSEVFVRAPTMAQVLRYICQRYFEGEAHRIKEYSIAVEALGRPSDFDQKRDSIVRVEAHRLRKRLREYYQGPGASHSVQIDLPQGSYTPVFVHRTELRPAAGAAPPPGGVLVDVRNAPSPPSRSAPWSVTSSRIVRRYWLAAAAVLALATAGFSVKYWLETRGKAAAASRALPLDATGMPLEIEGGAVRIRAGATANLTDLQGNTWLSDRFVRGGLASRSAEVSISGTLQDRFYESWREGDFSYEIPLKPGYYELTLYFVEPASLVPQRRQGEGAENTRTFNISINGNEVLHELDIVADTGGVNIPDIRIYKDVQPGADGKLRLDFRGVSGRALLSALAVTPGTQGRLRPIRLAAREEPYTDASGRIWSEDRYFSGGKLVRRVEPVQGTEDPELYRGERYGRLTYTIPVALGSTYTAIFHFAETWWGPSGKTGGGEGSRLFDIFCNGENLVRDFDVYKEAGGDHRAIRKTFTGLRPNGQGKLVFTMVPSRNYAFINALEILDEGSIQ